MNDSLNYSKPLTIQSSYLWFLTLAFSMIIVMANWFDPRLIKIFGFTTDAGTLIFPFTFLLSDLITEVYGYKFARRAIWCGFIFNACFIGYCQLVIHMPSPDYPTNNDVFDSLLKVNSRIIIASVISYICSEPLNSYVMAAAKIKMRDRLLGMRFVMSTVIASFIGSVVFTAIAFSGTMQLPHLISLAITMWLFKVIIELLGLPLSIRLVHYLKQREKIDMYDKKTSFNIFNFDTNYSSSDNEYRAYA